MYCLVWRKLFIIMLSELENTDAVLSGLINRMPQRSVSTLPMLLHKLF